MEPMLVSGMRRHPDGQVRHIPLPPIGMGGTSTQGFLTEYDRAIREAKAEAWDEGYNSRWDNSVVTRSLENPYRSERLDADR